MRCSKNIKECLPGKEKRKMALQADKTRQSPLCSFLKTSRKVFLWILKKREGRYRKASLTVEAAVAVRFPSCCRKYFGDFDIYRMQSLIKTSLHQSAMELGMHMEKTEILLLDQAFPALFVWHMREVECLILGNM